MEGDVVDAVLCGLNSSYNETEGLQLTGKREKV